MRKFFLILSFFLVSSLVFGVQIDGSFRAASATNITQGVYEDDMYSKYDYRYYKINVPKPSRVVVKFELEPGSHSQAVEYEFKGSTLRNDVINKEYFTGQEPWEVEFEDSFDVKEVGDYILKIGKYNNWFLGNYIFQISFTCLSRDDNADLECIGGGWVNKTAEPEEVPVEGLNFSKPVEKVICKGCSNDDSCYDIGTLFNDSFCSQNGSILSFFEEGDGCNFDYECLSGLCKKKSCYEPGLWDKLVDFFKELF